MTTFFQSNLITQIISISLMNLKNIPARIGSSMIIVVGIGGVVAVLVAVLAMVKGFETTLQGAGLNDRVIILRAGSNSEINGSISFDHSSIIENKPGILTGKKGPLIAGESYVSININKRNNDSGANVPFRGVSENSFRVRPEVNIVSGRNIEFGKYELIAGINSANQFQGLDVGNTITLRNAQWKVVGLFTADGSIYESEIWTDVLMLNSVFNRGGTYSSIIARMHSSLDFEKLHREITNDPRLLVKVQRESDFYSAQSNTTAQLIRGVGFSIAIIMAVGAIFAVLNTMYSSVSTRSIEIATLRALGFGNLPIVFSVMIESMALALLGGSIGGALTYLIFNGFTASTIGTNTQVSFNFLVTQDIITTGIILSCLLGLLGGLFPSIRASRLPISVALRGN